jgi:hypothetical protein
LPAHKPEAPTSSRGAAGAQWQLRTSLQRALTETRSRCFRQDADAFAGVLCHGGGHEQSHRQS